MKYFLLLLLPISSLASTTFMAGDCLKDTDKDYWENGFYKIEEVGNFSYKTIHFINATSFYDGDVSIRFDEIGLKDPFKKLNKFTCPKN